jgi:hypothetical protein
MPCVRWTDRFGVNIRKQVWNCRGCSRGGDVVALVEHLDNCGFLEAVRTLMGTEPGRPAARSAPMTLAEEHPREEGGGAGGGIIWRQSKSPHHSIVQRYMNEVRRLPLPAGVVSEVMRCHLSLKLNHPGHELNGKRVGGMVCLYRDVITNAPCGIHRTFLYGDGRPLLDAKGKKIRKGLGRTKRAAIKLDHDENVTTGLTITEGIETGVAAQLAGLRPVWATGSASGISFFPVLAGVECLTILVDRDENEAGQNAADECAWRWTMAGREVIQIIPKRPGEDFNDVSARMRAA